MKNSFVVIHILFFFLCTMVSLTAQETIKKIDQEKRHLLSIKATIETFSTCIDSEDGRIEVTVKGGKLPYKSIELIGRAHKEQLMRGTIFSNLNPDRYTVKVIDASGQEASIAIQLEVLNPMPIADFEVAADGEKVVFNNTSDNAGRWTWFFEKGMISHDKSPAIAMKSKLQEVCLSASNGCNVTDVYCEMINIKEFLVKETPELEVNSLTNSSIDNYSITAYPNPTTDLLTVACPVGKEINQIEVFNATGHLLQTTKVVSNNTNLSFQQFSSGTYFLKVSGLSSTEVIKIQKMD